MRRGAAAAAAITLMVIPTVLPAYAYFAEPTEAQRADTPTVATQALTVVSTGEPASVGRDGYSVTAKPKPNPTRVTPSSAKAYASLANTFVNNPTSPVQWPFTQGVPISSGFGPRVVSGCGFCSSYHQGLDMNPGSGTPIQSIADGVVAEVGNPRGSYGVYAIIDHVVGGRKVSSMYAHMLLGSLQLSVGDTVLVGQEVGKVGSTGASTGAHLHFEVRLDGTLPVDPYAWLKGKVGS